MRSDSSRLPRYPPPALHGAHFSPPSFSLCFAELLLGTGGYATVRLAKWKHPHVDLSPDEVHEDRLVAVKVVDKRAIQDKEKYMKILLA